MSAGWIGSIAVSTKRKSEIFFARGLDMTGKSVPQILGWISRRRNPPSTNPCGYPEGAIRRFDAFGGLR
jgi:hypothetical protein